MHILSHGNGIHGILHGVLTGILHGVSQWLSGIIQGVSHSNRFAFILQFKLFLQ